MSEWFVVCDPCLLETTGEPASRQGRDHAYAVRCALCLRETATWHSLVTPWERAHPDEHLQFVIYKHPDDYPQGYVVRRVSITPNGLRHGVAKLANTLVAAHMLVPDGLVCLPRFPNDHPSIVEVWI